MGEIDNHAAEGKSYGCDSLHGKLGPTMYRPTPALSHHTVKTELEESEGRGNSSAMT